MDWTDEITLSIDNALRRFDDMSVEDFFQGGFEEQAESDGESEVTCYENGVAFCQLI